MKKFIKKNALFLSALAGVILIILIIAITNRPAVSYKMPVQNMLTVLKDTSRLISPFGLDELIAQKKGNLVMVDVRPSEEFGKGHIKEAVNIPVMNMLNKEALSFFKDISAKGQEVVLYGNDQLEANGPWLLLTQVGVTNLKVLLGGYQIYKLLPLNDSVLFSKNHLVWAEKSIIDTAALRKKSASVSVPVNQKQAARKESVVPVKKEASSGGGC
jgi:rhodanese-related sulfurtransferase